MLTLQGQIRRISRGQVTVYALMVALATIWFALAYRPQTQRLAQLRGETEHQQSQLASSKDQTRVLPSVSRDVESLRKRLGEFKLPSKTRDFPQFLSDLGKLGPQCAVTSDWKQLEKRAVDNFSEVPLRITCNGDFVNAFQFLRLAEELPVLSRVRAIDITTADKTGRVNVFLTMNIYLAAE